MSHRKHTSVLLALALVIAATSLWTSVSIARSSHNMAVTLHAKQKGTSISGSLTGTFGNGTQSGKATSATAVDVIWHVKGGTIHLTADGALAGGTKTKGTWKIVGGTGKYKHITGSGVQTGDIKTLTFHYTGRISY